MQREEDKRRHPGCEEIRKIVLIIGFSDVHKELLTFKKSFILMIYCIFCFGLRISIWPKSWALKTSMDSLSIWLPSKIPVQENSSVSNFRGRSVVASWSWLWKRERRGRMIILTGCLLSVSRVPVYRDGRSRFPHQTRVIGFFFNRSGFLLPCLIKVLMYTITGP